MAVDLHSNLLIEASAGTGKTWTLAQLVVRLIAEQSPRVGLSDILIVTFSRKAAGEMRERIALFLRQQAVNPARSPNQRERLQDALEHFDKANIYTIHAWCSELLRRYPLETGVSFLTKVTRKEDLSPILHELILKWNKKYASSAKYGRLYRATFPVKEDFKRNFSLLEHLVAQLLYERVTLQPSPQETEAFLSLAEQFDRGEGALHKTLKNLLNIPVTEQELLEIAQSMKVTYQKGPRKKLISLLARWSSRLPSFEGLHDELFDGKAIEWLDRYSPEVLISKSRGDGDLLIKEALHPTFRAALRDFLAAISLLRDPQESTNTTKSLYPGALRSLFVANLLEEIFPLLEEERARTGGQSFNDLVGRVASSLTTKESPLKTSLREEYKIALIDEFQDTDEQQWKIFKPLFGKSPHHRYCLIGDPKQSIYGFRGANLETYFQAAKETPHHHTLSTNYRSSPLLVESFNLFFRSLFASYSPGITPITFSPSSPLPHLSANPQETTTFLASPFSPHSKKESPTTWEAIGTIRRLYVETINRLLCDTSFPLLPGEIAILTDTQQEGILYRDALSQKGIPSRLGRQDQVIATLEALALHNLLHLLLNLYDETLLKAALLSFFFDLAPEELLLLEQRGGLALCEPILICWRRWAERGQFSRVLSNLSTLSEKIVEVLLTGSQETSPRMEWLLRPWQERVLHESGGTQRLENVTHLLELLYCHQHENGQDLRGLCHQLFRWIQNEDPPPSEERAAVRQVQSSSAVQILTTHASKGLEFPIVFFAGGLSEKKGHDTNHYRFIDTSGRRVLDFQKRSSSHLKQQLFDWEERKRLFYVGFTRAKKRLYLPLVPWLPPSSPLLSFYSALVESHHDKGEGLPPHLRLPSSTKEKAAHSRSVYEKLLEFCRSHSNLLQIESARPLEETPKFSVSGTKEPIKTAVVATESTPGFPGRRGFISSFSLLQRKGELPFDEVPEEQRMGPMWGTSIHRILEKMDYTIAENVDLSSFQEKEEVRQLCEDELSKNFSSDRCTKLGPQATELLWRTLTTELFPGFSLSLLERSARLHELEFLFSVPKTTTLSLRQKHFVERGYLKGFMDLVFCWQEKIYLVDWKTEWAPSYDPKDLSETFLAHQYDLQGSLYLAALHRFFNLSTQKEKACDYSQRFGGCFYLFLRGLQAGTDLGIVSLNSSESEVAQLAAKLTGEDRE